MGIFSIFVDNLLVSLDPKGLYPFFTKFGVVKDVFIPNKRRKTTRSRFGFVHYDCPVATEVVVQKAVGMWCDEKVLQVKRADFGKEQQVGLKEAVNRITEQNMNQYRQSTTFRNAPLRSKSFVEIVKGKGASGETTLTVKAVEEGNG
ncbi:serine/arginine-rich splicing factor SC35-like [Camellia sinensis]|uniref:serine/arginine-rich splicing factor SC35-like n=1 Tax=Camellia sinensis TaxID=4442 RepID=UPI00103684AD|nr:serine/arginine-rich splicing factor SC35-like [Camellia sinensis]